jgi:Na+-translocating ferredoxin:NAD+ oxidoreductase subunit D
MKTSPAYRVSVAPHLRNPDSVFKMAGTHAAALLPALIVSLVLFPVQTLIALATVWAAAVLTEFICAKIFKHEFRFFDLQAFLTTAAFFLLLPASYPLIYMSLGIFVAIFGRELFGGKNNCFIHPVLLGSIFLQLNFPVFYRAGSGILFIDSGGLGAWLVMTALLTGGAILMSRKILEWELPLIYIFTAVILEKIFPESVALSLRHVFFTAFFLMIQPGTAPLTRNARRWVALLAALVAWILDSVTSPAHIAVPEAFALLLMNGVTVWLDQWILPSGSAQSRVMTKV